MNTSGAGRTTVTGGGVIVVDSTSPAAVRANGSGTISAAEFDIAGAPRRQHDGRRQWAAEYPETELHPGPRDVAPP